MTPIALSPRLCAMNVYRDEMIQRQTGIFGFRTLGPQRESSFSARSGSLRFMTALYETVSPRFIKKARDFTHSTKFHFGNFSHEISGQPPSSRSPIAHINNTIKHNNFSAILPLFNCTSSSCNRNTLFSGFSRQHINATLTISRLCSRPSAQNHSSAPVFLSFSTFFTFVFIPLHPSRIATTSAESSLLLSSTRLATAVSKPMCNQTAHPIGHSFFLIALRTQTSDTAPFAPAEESCQSHKAYMGRFLCLGFLGFLALRICLSTASGAAPSVPLSFTASTFGTDSTALPS